jgi:hypothetical protein
MIQIILSDEQARAVQDAAEGVELRDERGKLVGYISRPPSNAEISAAKQRLKSDGPWYTTQQVLDHLQSLEQG